MSSVPRWIMIICNTVQSMTIINKSIFRANMMQRMRVLQAKRRSSDNVYHHPHLRVSGAYSGEHNDHGLNVLNNKRLTPCSQHVAGSLITNNPFCFCLNINSPLCFMRYIQVTYVYMVICITLCGVYSFGWVLDGLYHRSCFR